MPYSVQAKVLHQGSQIAVEALSTNGAMESLIKIFMVGLPFFLERYPNFPLWKAEFISLTIRNDTWYRWHKLVLTYVKTMEKGVRLWEVPALRASWAGTPVASLRPMDLMETLAGAVKVSRKRVNCRSR
jgi:hypothetical protein